MLGFSRRSAAKKGPVHALILPEGRQLLIQTHPIRTVQANTTRKRLSTGDCGIKSDAKTSEVFKTSEVCYHHELVLA